MKRLRLNYVLDGDQYVGVPVNLTAVVVQADTLEELNDEAKKLTKMYLETLSDALDKDSFELHQVESFESTRIVQMQQRLMKYEEMFGII